MSRQLTAGLISALCGLLTALCYPNAGFCFLAWFSLAPLIRIWSSAPRPREAFFSGAVAGFAFHGTVLFWIYSTCRFAQIPVWAATLAWSALAAALSVNWGLIAVLGRWLCGGRSAVWRPWIWAASWTAVSAAISYLTPRLAADLLAYTQYRHLSLIQIGALAGPYGLGFLIVALNAAMASAWEATKARSGAAEAPQWARSMALVLACLTCAWVYGEWELMRRAERPAGATARVEILQPAIDQYRKWDSRFEADIRARFDDLLNWPRAVPPKMIIWPESALPWVIARKGEVPWASAWARKTGAWQLVGAVTSEGERSFNSVLLIDPSGDIAGHYDKRQLVPFGEFVPMAWLGAWIGKLNELGGMTEGRFEQSLLNTPLGLTAAGICYEAMFPGLARADAARGARFIVNLTNDGWYKDTWGPHQHFIGNVFRAVESRITVVRAGNSGISAVIDPWGVAVARLDLNQTGRLEADVALSSAFPKGSFYSRTGDWLGVLCGLAVAAWAIRSFRK